MPPVSGFVFFSSSGAYVSLSHATSAWWEGGNCRSFNFSMSKNFLFGGKLKTTIHNLRLEVPGLGEFTGKIEISSTHSHSVGNLRMPVGKLQLLPPLRPSFFHDTETNNVLLL